MAYILRHPHGRLFSQVDQHGITTRVHVSARDAKHMIYESFGMLWLENQ